MFLLLEAISAIFNLAATGLYIHWHIASFFLIFYLATTEWEEGLY